MLGKMVGSVVLPETIELMAAPVVEVEPEIQDDGIQGQLQWQPPAQRERLLRAVGKEDREHRSNRCGHLHGPEDFIDACIRYLISLVLVSIEEAVFVSQSSKNLDLSERVELHCDGVQEECTDGVQAPASEGNVEILESDWP